MLPGGFSRFGDGVDDGPAGCLVLTSAAAKEWEGSEVAVTAAAVVPEAAAHPVLEGTGRGPKRGVCESAVVIVLKKCLESVHSDIVSNIKNSTFQFLLQNFSGHLAILQLMHELPSVPPLHPRAVPYRVFYKTRWHSAN